MDPPNGRSPPSSPASNLSLLPMMDRVEWKSTHRESIDCSPVLCFRGFKTSTKNYYIKQRLSEEYPLANIQLVGEGVNRAGFVYFGSSKEAYKALEHSIVLTIDGHQPLVVETLIYPDDLLPPEKQKEVVKTRQDYVRKRSHSSSRPLRYLDHTEQPGYSGHISYSGQTGRSKHTGYSGRSEHSGSSAHSGHLGYSGQTNQSGHSRHSGTSGHSGHSRQADYTGHSGHSEHPSHSKQYSYSGHSSHSEHPGHSGHPDHSKQRRYSGHSGHSEHPDQLGHPGYSRISRTERESGRSESGSEESDSMEGGLRRVWSRDGHNYRPHRHDHRQQDKYYDCCDYEEQRLRRKEFYEPDGGCYYPHHYHPHHHQTPPPYKRRYPMEFCERKRYAGYTRYMGDQQRQELPTQTIYVGNLPPETSPVELRSIFRPFGEVEEVRMKEGTKGPNPFAFIRFSTLEAAVQAKEEMAGYLVGHQAIKTGYSLKLSRSRVKVSGIYTAITFEQARRELDNFGQIQHMEYEEGSKELYVTYWTEEAAVDLLEFLSEKPFPPTGQRVRVRMAAPVCLPEYTTTDFKREDKKRKRRSSDSLPSPPEDKQA